MNKNKKDFFNSNDGQLFWTIFVIFIIIAVLVSGLVKVVAVVYNYPLRIKEKYEQIENESIIEDGRVAFINVLGYKSEYYLNEPFDFDNDITIKAGYYKNGAVVYVQYDKTTNFTPIHFLEGYNENGCPTTDTLGNHSFTINYGGSQKLCTYKVVEFKPYHFLTFVKDTITGTNNTMLDIQNIGTTSICKNGTTKAFVNGISYSIYYTPTIPAHKTMFYFGEVASFMTSAMKFITDTNNYYVSYNRNQYEVTTPSVCTQNGNIYSGSMWTTTGKYFDYELDCSSNNKGLKLTINVDGKTTWVLGNFDEEKYNLCIQGEEDYDILLNYSKYVYSYATQTAGLNNNLNTLNYSENFANSGINSLVYNITTNTHIYN